MMKKIPVFGDGIYGRSAAITAQRRVNCYYETRGDSDPNGIIIIGTPGCKLFSSINAGPVRGMHPFTSLKLMYVATGSELYEVNPAGTPSFIGLITVGDGIVAMADNGTQLLILDGTAGWIYNTGTAVLAKITDPNFPQNARTCAFDSGFFIVDDPSAVGRWRISNLYDGTVWSSLDFAAAESSPDPLTAVHAYKGSVLLFGSLTTEVWQNVGSSGFPYSPVLSANQDIGIAARYSLCQVNNTLLFLGKTGDSSPQIFRMDGLQIGRASTNDLDAIIRRFSGFEDAVAYGYVTDGHPMYQITFPSGNRTFILDLSTQMWSEMQSGLSDGPHLTKVGTGFDSKNYAGDATNGIIYQLDEETYADNGMAILRLVQTKHFYLDHNVIGVDEVYLQMDTGKGLQSGQGSDPQVIMQVSKDGGNTFGNERWKSIGKVGQYYYPRPIWNRLGSGRDFVFRFKMTDPVKFMISDSSVTVRSE